MGLIPMFVNMPHKKMKRIRTFGFVAKCECGHQHKFKGTDFDLSKSNASSAQFNNIYICPKCGESYDGLFENNIDRDVWYRRTSPLGWLISAIMIFGLLFGGYKIISAIFYSPPTNTDFNKATNKQVEDFYKWQQKQDQQEWENQPAFNNK